MRLKISNLTSLVVIAAAIAAAFMAGPTWGLWQNAAVFVGVLVIGTMAFSRGLLGGGDVKLLAAAGLWFDLSSVVGFIAMVFLSGGVVAIAYVLTGTLRRRTGNWKTRQIPYGIAIAVGVLGMMLLDRGSIGHQQHIPTKFTTIPR